MYTAYIITRKRGIVRWMIKIIHTISEYFWKWIWKLNE